MRVEGVSSEIRDQVAVVRLDDGKANALSPARIAALGEAVDEAEARAGALLLVGREGATIFMLRPALLLALK